MNRKKIQKQISNLCLKTFFKLLFGFVATCLGADTKIIGGSVVSPNSKVRKIDLWPIRAKFSNSDFRRNFIPFLKYDFQIWNLTSKFEIWPPNLRFGNIIWNLIPKLEICPFYFHIWNLTPKLGNSTTKFEIWPTNLKMDLQTWNSTT